ncbi:hypothetical protein [Streptomyces sp. AS02]|uniref:hypothetical protein n=1 Tax=Streptomyces sp. AS02 TaxID=2938946 RepID=UPI00201FCD71|nr:hypothetical protein [Streptomyces sp. AS02]MCL8011276.1 hypothetical protein [Streptomyces sp. AS02]
MENKTTPGNKTGQTSPVSETPQGESEDDDIGRLTIGVILLISIVMTLLAELAFTLAGMGLKETAMVGLSACVGTFGLGYVLAKRVGYIPKDGSKPSR